MRGRESRQAADIRFWPGAKNFIILTADRYVNVVGLAVEEAMPLSSKHCSFTAGNVQAQGEVVAGSLGPWSCRILGPGTKAAVGASGQCPLTGGATPSC